MTNSIDTFHTTIITALGKVDDFIIHLSIELNNFSNKLHIDTQSLQQKLPEFFPTNIKSMYTCVINNLKIKCTDENTYWGLDLKFINLDEAIMMCHKYPLIIVSEKWKVIGNINDIIALAKLAGLTYDKLASVSTIPGFHHEDIFWIDTLQLTKFKSNLSCPQSPKIVLSQFSSTPPSTNYIHHPIPQPDSDEINIIIPVVSQNMESPIPSLNNPYTPVSNSGDNHPIIIPSSIPELSIPKNNSVKNVLPPTPQRIPITPKIKK